MTGKAMIVVVMGVTGSGKTTVGMMLADAMQCPFLEGDSLHSKANVDKMSHQPVEQLAGLRAMPNMMVLRPSDATEAVEAWRVALTHTEGPAGLVLTRQKLPVIDRNTLAAASGLAQGAYVLADSGGSVPEVILIATGYARQTI